MFWFKKKEEKQESKEEIKKELLKYKVGDKVFLRDYWRNNSEENCGFAFTSAGNLFLKTDISYRIKFIGMHQPEWNIFLEVGDMVVKTLACEIDRKEG